MDSISSQYIQLLVESAPNLLANRYLTAASVTILLYDYALTLNEEIRLVWSRPLGLVPVLFLFSRYFAIANLLFVAHITSGMGEYSTKFCQGWIIEAAVSFLLSVAISHFILIRRLYALYDQRKYVLRILQVAFAITYLIAFAFGIATVRDMEAKIVWLPLVVNQCALVSEARYLIGFWTPQVAFELIAFGLTIWNAAERPRRAQSKLFADLNRDGFIYFFVLFGIRAANMILSALSNPLYDFLILYFTWAITIMTLSRMILRVESMREEASQDLQPTGFLTSAFELADRKATSLPSNLVEVDTVTTMMVR